MDNEEAIPKVIEVSYTQHTNADLEELGIDHKQVKDWYIKWHCLHIEDLEGNWQEYQLDDLYDMDMQRPFSAKVFDKDVNHAVLGGHHEK